MNFLYYNITKHIILNTAIKQSVLKKRLFYDHDFSTKCFFFLSYQWEWRFILVAIAIDE